jgi:hypothetical protein
MTIAERECHAGWLWRRMRAHGTDRAIESESSGRAYSELLDEVEQLAQALELDREAGELR